MTICRPMIDPTISAHYTGDVRALLKRLPDRCVQTCVTSPPYWGLRSYLDDDDPMKEFEIGLEGTPEEYVAVMVEVFEKVRRVLRDDGALWLNMGDCYVTNPRGPGGAEQSTLEGTSNAKRRAKGSVDPKNLRKYGHQGALKHKDLVGIPWMAAFALRADGWYLRSEVIWHKPSPMPESVTDRPTKAHEQIFLLSKSASYFYDADAIAEPAVRGAAGSRFDTGKTAEHQLRRSSSRERDEVDIRNKRSVWTVASQPYAGAHFATFPPDLIEPCILACSRPGDLVLDPFFGSGTTGQVAEKHERLWIGFDINPKYAELAKERTAQRSLPLSR